MKQKDFLTRQEFDSQLEKLRDGVTLLMNSHSVPYNSCVYVLLNQIQFALQGVECFVCDLNLKEKRF